MISGQNGGSEQSSRKNAGTIMAEPSASADCSAHARKTLHVITDAVCSLPESATREGAALTVCLPVRSEARSCQVRRE